MSEPIDLLVAAKHEIESLRRENEIFKAKVSTLDFLEKLFNTYYTDNIGLKPDLSFSIGRYIEEWRRNAEQHQQAASLDASSGARFQTGPFQGASESGSAGVSLSGQDGGKIPGEIGRAIDRKYEALLSQQYALQQHEAFLEKHQRALERENGKNAGSSDDIGRAEIHEGLRQAR